MFANSGDTTPPTQSQTLPGTGSCPIRDSCIKNIEADDIGNSTLTTHERSAARAGWKTGCSEWGPDQAVEDRRVEHDYVFDRLGGERLIQAYRLLVSERRRTVRPTQPRRSVGSRGGASCEDRRDLRSGLVGPAERGADDHQSDERSARVRRRARLSGS